MLYIKADEELGLRLWEAGDADRLYALIDANRSSLREWLPWVDVTVSSADSLRFITDSLSKYGASTDVNLCILYKGSPVGAIGLNCIDWQNRNAIIGYWIAGQCQGKGIVTRACGALIEYAFITLMLNRIEIRAGEGNAKSRAVPERLGFKLEGRLRQAQWLNDRFIDAVVYGMIREEWLSRDK